MKQVTHIVLVVLTVFCLVFHSTVIAQIQDMTVPGRVIVEFEPGVVLLPANTTESTTLASVVSSPSALAAMNSIQANGIEKVFPSAVPGQTRVISPITGQPAEIADLSEYYIVKFPTNVPVESAISALSAIGVVKSVERDYRAVQDATPNDSLFPQQWHLKNNVNSKFDIDVASAWDLSKGDSIIIAIVGVGVDSSQPDLNAHMYRGAGSEWGYDSTTETGRHDTYVAGVAAAVTNNHIGVAGVGWNARIMPRVAPHFYVSELASDIQDAAQKGAEVLNCSWHKTQYDSASALTYLKNSVRNAFNLGSVIVSSMGNDYMDSTFKCYPAAYDSFVIAVGALTPANGHDTVYVAPDQNTGPWIDVTAPGDSVLTTAPRNWGYLYTSGTSISTPQVAGEAAQLLSANKSLTNSQVMSIIKGTARLFPGWSSSPQSYGSGLIDCYQAVLLGLAYANKSDITTASWNNSGRHLAKGSGKLHEVFTSGGEIFYRRQNLSNGTWEQTQRISSGTGMSSDASIVVAHDGSLHAVWQWQLNTITFDLYYSRSLDNGNSWSTPTPLALNIGIGSNQWNIYPVIAERNSTQLVVVFCCSAGLEYCTSSNNGVSWSAVANTRSSYSNPAWYIWYPSMASGSNYLTLTYDYRFWGVWSMTYNGTTWSSESNVNAGTGTVYDRYSSVAVMNSDNPVTAWCSQKYVNGQLDPDFRIMFRRGNPDNTWGSWFVEFAKTTGISDLYPSIASYSGGEDLPYGIDILYHRTNQEVRSEVYNSQYTKWQNCLFSGTGQWPNLTLANPHLSYPVATWTDQSSSPYELKLSSSNCGLPKTTMTQYAQHRRAILQNRQSSSTLSLEVNSIKVVSASGDTVALPFKKHGISDTLNITLGNIWDYLGTDTVTLPTDVNWLLFDKTVDSEVKHDSGGSLGISNLAVLTYLLQLIDEPSGTQLAVLDANPNSSTAIASISPYAGRSVVIRPSLIASNSLEASVVLGVGDVFVEQNIPTKGQTVTGLRSKPERLTLDQNYPNPFNPTSTINYALPFDGQVVLKVYDVLGREVKTLVDQLQSAGYKSVTFDASSFSNGIYFYRLEAVDVSNPSHSFVQVRKMLLLK